jgi:hypothetical protein
VDWIHLAQGVDKGWALVNMVMSHLVPENAENFPVYLSVLLPSQRGLSYLE